jgi:hypothetical protein
LKHEHYYSRSYFDFISFSKLLNAAWRRFERSLHTAQTDAQHLRGNV